MAKYNVEFKCGHTETIELFGKERDRESYIAYAQKNRICSECYKKQMEKERQAAKAKYEEENDKAERLAKEQQLPELTGSEKQVRWANTIRQQFIEAAESGNGMNIIGSYFGYLNLYQNENWRKYSEYFDEVEQIDVEKVVSLLKEAILSKTESRFFIDNRGKQMTYYLVGIIDQYIKEEYDEKIKAYFEKQFQERQAARTLDHPVIFEDNEKEEVEVPDGANATITNTYGTYLTIEFSQKPSNELIDELKQNEYDTEDDFYGKIVSNNEAEVIDQTICLLKKHGYHVIEK